MLSKNNNFFTLWRRRIHDGDILIMLDNFDGEFYYVNIYYSSRRLFNINVLYGEIDDGNWNKVNDISSEEKHNIFISIFKE